MRLLMILAFLLLVIAPVPVRAETGEITVPPGSSFGLTPPQGFRLSKSFSGFEDREARSSILLMEFPPEAFPAMAEGFTPEALASQGIEVKTYEEISIADCPAILFIAVQYRTGVAYRRWILLFGAPSLTGMATVSVPAALAGTATDAEVRAALSSIRLATTPAAKTASLPFTFRETEQLRLVRTLAGSTAIFATGEGQGDYTAPVFFITRPLGEPLMEDPVRFARRATQSLATLDTIEIEREARITILGTEGVEIVASGRDYRTGTRVRLVHWIGFFPGNGYIRMVGIAPESMFASALPQFEELRDSVRLP